MSLWNTHGHNLFTTRFYSNMWYKVFPSHAKCYYRMFESLMWCRVSSSLLGSCLSVGRPQRKDGSINLKNVSSCVAMCGRHRHTNGHWLCRVHVRLKTRNRNTFYGSIQRLRNSCQFNGISNFVHYFSFGPMCSQCLPVCLPKLRVRRFDLLSVADKSPQILAPNFFLRRCVMAFHIYRWDDNEKHKIKHSPSIIMLALQVFYFYALNFRSALAKCRRRTVKNASSYIRTSRLRWIHLNYLYDVHDSFRCVARFSLKLHFRPSQHRNQWLRRHNISFHHSVRRFLFHFAPTK